MSDRPQAHSGLFGPSSMLTLPYGKWQGGTYDAFICTISTPNHRECCAGLMAWIVEKFRTWSDCGGDVESRFSKDELLTNVAI